MVWSDVSTEECSENEENEEDWDNILASLNGIEQCLIKPEKNTNNETDTHKNETRDIPKNCEPTLPEKDADNDIIFEKICKSDPTRKTQQESSPDNPLASKTQPVHPANTPIATINLDDIPEAEFTICESDDDEEAAVPGLSRDPVPAKQKSVNHVDLTANSISDDDSQQKKNLSDGEIPTSETNDDDSKGITVERVLKWRKVYLKCKKQKRKRQKMKKRKNRIRNISVSPDHLAINEYNPASEAISNANSEPSHSVTLPEKRSERDSQKPRNYRSRSHSRDSDSSSLRWSDFYDQRKSRKRERTRERSSSQRRRSQSKYRSRSRKRSSKRRTRSSRSYGNRSETRSHSTRRKEKSTDEIREQLRKKNEEAVETLVKTNKEVHTNTSLVTESLKIQVTDGTRMVEHAERQQTMAHSQIPPGPMIPPSYPFSSNGYFTYTNVQVRQNVYCYNPYMPPWY